MPGSIYACRTKRLGCEAYEPLVELVNGSRDVGLPELLKGFCSLLSQSSRHYPHFGKLCQEPRVGKHCHLRSLFPPDLAARSAHPSRSRGLHTPRPPRLRTWVYIIVVLESLCTRNSNPQPRRPASESACQGTARSARSTSNKISAPALHSSNLLFRSKFQLLPTRLAPVAAAIFAGKALLLRS